MFQQADTIAINDSVVPAIMADTTVVEQPAICQPQFEGETLFSQDTLSYSEVRLPGQPGDPMPYTMHGDDVLVCLMLLCFLISIGVLAHSRQTIFYHLKEFFYIPRMEYADAGMPSKFSLFILNFQTCLLFGISYYFYTTHYVTADDYLLSSPYALIGVYFAVFTVYFLMKSIIYQLVNGVFFDGKKNRLMVWMLSFIAALEGIAFFPAVIMQTYVGISMQTIVYYFVFVLIIAKLMTFYKCWVIFFRQVGVYLQIILYLCALEIIPLLILWGVLVTITNELKVIF